MHEWNDTWPHWDEFNKLLNEFDGYLRRNKINPLQVKEKFGTLRIYGPYLYQRWRPKPSLRSIPARYNSWKRFYVYKEMPAYRLAGQVFASYLRDLIHYPITLWHNTPVYKWHYARRYKWAVHLMRSWLYYAVKSHTHMAHELLCTLDEDLVKDLLTPRECENLGHPSAWSKAGSNQVTCAICGATWERKKSIN